MLTTLNAGIFCANGDSAGGNGDGVGDVSSPLNGYLIELQLALQSEACPKPFLRFLRLSICFLSSFDCYSIASP